MFFTTTFQPSTTADEAGAIRSKPKLSLPIRSQEQVAKVEGAKASLTPKMRLCHPFLGGRIFGRVPALPDVPHAVENAPIVLSFGFHDEQSGGMGAVHIWARHRGHMTQRGSHSVLEVNTFVARVLADGAVIYPAKTVPGQTRLIAFQRGVGLVILGLNGRNGTCRWEVITGFIADTPDGNPLGKVLAMPGQSKP